MAVGLWHTRELDKDKDRNKPYAAGVEGGCGADDVSSRCLCFATPGEALGTLGLYLF
jgi:hypothetical protein